MSGAPARRSMRVADVDRQAAADRLRTAHDDGRLDLLEYDERLARAYRAVTYADLDALFTDLPGPARSRGDRPVRRRRGWVALLMLILWAGWLTGVAVNLAVWTLVSLGNGRPEYFWPMWLAIPGIVLAVVTVTIRALRGARG